MERRIWLAVAAVLLLLGSACTANGPLVQASASPSPSAASPVPSPVPSPSPASRPDPASLAVACQETVSAASEPLAITWSHDPGELALSSLRDPLRPTTLCTMNSLAIVRFISGTEIGYVTNSSSYDPIAGNSVIQRMNLIDLKPVDVAVVQGDVMDVA